MERAVLRHVGQGEHLVCTIMRAAKPDAIRTLLSPILEGFRHLYGPCKLTAAAGDEIDADPVDYRCAHIRALTVRHLVEQECTEVLQRLGRAYGPYPLAMEKSVSERYQELQLYLRQCHAERDLESLGEEIRKAARL
jgi:hypothetical protein